MGILLFPKSSHYICLTLSPTQPEEAEEHTATFGLVRLAVSYLGASNLRTERRSPPLYTVVCCSFSSLNGDAYYRLSAPGVRLSRYGSLATTTRHATTHCHKCISSSDLRGGFWTRAPPCIKATVSVAGVKATGGGQLTIKMIKVDRCCASTPARLFLPGGRSGISELSLKPFARNHSGVPVREGVHFLPHRFLVLPSEKTQYPFSRSPFIPVCVCVCVCTCLW